MIVSGIGCLVVGGEGQHCMRRNEVEVLCGFVGVEEARILPGGMLSRNRSSRLSRGL